MEDRTILICECHSLEHQVAFWLDGDDGMIYIESHLTTHRNFWQRLWYGIRYAFGYRSRYGAWDEVLLGPESQVKLKQMLDHVQQDPEGSRAPFDQQHGGY
jgi:hypothetical protein